MIISEPMTERESMIQIYSDFHKDAYGFRPRGVNYDAMTLADLKADFASFEALCDQNEREEERANEYARVEFEKRVQSVIDMGAGDRETALRWIVESFEEDVFYYGVEGFVTYELHLGYNDYATALAAEFLPIIQAHVAEAA
jgi:hypothetical protein